MNLYHRTFAADAIFREGFRDGTGRYLTPEVWSGVWLSDIALDSNEDAGGDTLLVIEIPEDVVAEYEWVEEDKLYREFLVPAGVVNKYGPPRVVSPEEEEGLPDPRFPWRSQ